MRLALLFLVLFGSNLGRTQLIELDKELLWEVSNPKLGVKSYLFGTLHANDRELFELSDSVYVAFEQAKKIVLETDIYSLFATMDTRKTLPETRIDDKGKPYTSMIQTSQTLYGSEDGMPQFLDAYFQILGLQLDKETIALEKLEDQYALSNEFKLSERRILDNQINAFTQEKLLELYLRGDLDALQRFMKSYLSVQDSLYNEVIVKRNQQMLDKLIGLLKTPESFFCAVGAGHLGGEEGLLQLLRGRGFKVRPVRWTFSQPAPKSKAFLKKQTEYIQVDPISGLVAKFPGKPYVQKLPDGSQVLIYRELGQGNTFEITIQLRDSTVSAEEIASIYINPPAGAAITKKSLDGGTVVFQGLSDTYPEGLNYVQIQFGTNYFAVIKCYGGHKFMHSDRPTVFFGNVWFD
ncbi:MAG: TraB/GumN family protein [Cryomorphaceae bacterium]|nr:TraB/GumN family protein [Cryomorphaceae bacterium]